MNKIIYLICILLNFSLLAQQNNYILNDVLDKIHYQSQKQEKIQSLLKNYKYKQFIHFIKMDSDGEIDEQSKRKYNIYVKSDSLKKRELISAFQFEDNLWTDVTDDEKSGSKERHRESKSFSLSEMVGPENRSFYTFNIVGEDIIDSLNVIHLEVTVKEEDEDRFQGDLWFETNEYSLVQAELIPSEFPTFVDSMKMKFKLQKMDSLWFPKKIEFDAEVGILFLFSGIIHSEILFSDFEFNQKFEQTWFDNLEMAN